MIFEGRSDLVANVEVSSHNGEYIEIVTLTNAMALVLSHNALALYRQRAQVGDALGNGLLSMSALPSDASLDPGQTPWVMSHSAGYVGLSNQMALLILPQAIRLYRQREDALHNRHALASLPLQ